MSATALIEPAQLITLADGPKDRPHAGAAQAELGLRPGHSVVIVDGAIYLRSRTHLFRIN